MGALVYGVAYREAGPARALQALIVYLCILISITAIYEIARLMRWVKDELPGLFRSKIQDYKQSRETRARDRQLTKARLARERIENEANNHINAGRIYDGLMVYERNGWDASIQTYLTHTIQVPNYRDLKGAIRSTVDELFKLKRDVSKGNRFVPDSYKNRLKEAVDKGLYALYYKAERLALGHNLSSGNLSKDELEALLEPHHNDLQRLNGNVRKSQASLVKLTYTADGNDNGVMLDMIMQDFDALNETARMIMESQEEMRRYSASSSFDDDLLRNARNEQKIKISRK